MAPYAFAQSFRTHLALFLASTLLAACLPVYSNAPMDALSADASETAVVRRAPAQCVPAGTGEDFFAPITDLPPLAAITLGTVLRCEIVEERNAWSVSQDAVWRASTDASASFGLMHYRILYLSQGPIGTPTVVSATVYLPIDASGRCGASTRAPIAAVQHGTTGTADGCAPSILPALGVDYMAIPLVGRGLAVVATDYQGLGTPGHHPYLVGESAAFSTLDAVRALTTMRDAAMDPGCIGTTVLLMGHSQGAHASLFAEQFVSTYGMGAGITLGGTIAYAPALGSKRVFEGTPLRADDATPGDVALLAMAMSGFMHYHGAPSTHSEWLTPAAADLVPSMIEGECLPSISLRIPGQFPTLGSLFTQSFLDAQSACALDPRRCAAFTPWDSFLARSVPGNFTTTRPTLIVQGDADTLVAPEGTQCIVDRMRARGDRTDVCAMPGTSHAEIVLHSWVEVIPWVDAVARGVDPVVPRCAGTLPRCLD